MSYMLNTDNGVLRVMGADILDDEHHAGVSALKGLSKEGRGYLSHHIRNSLQALILHKNDPAKVTETVFHIEEDLRRVGI